MSRTMRRYGPTLADDLLGRVCAVGALVCLVVVVLSIALRPERDVLGAVTAAVATLAGAALLAAAVGVRQNGALVDIGAGATILAGIGWMAWWLTLGVGWAALSGVLLMVLGGALIWLYGATLRVRYHPRFLTGRQIGTMIQIADAVIEGDGREALSPIQVAVNVDHLLARMNSPTTNDLRLLMILIEYGLPLLMLRRPVPFGMLGSHERRRAIAATIGHRGMFRKVARSLKLLSMMGYYGDAATAATTGYVPFELRSHDAEQKIQTPFVHPEPAG